MSQVTITRTTGNFKYTATFELSEAVAKAILERGCVSELQSGGAISGWEKAIAYPGDQKRPKGFERSSIPFNAANADALKRAIMGNEVVIGTNEKDEPIKEDMGAIEVLVEEYTGAEAATPKYAAERKFVKDYLAANGGKLRSGEPRTVESFAANPARSLPAPAVGPADEDGLAPWETDTTFLLAVREHMKALAAGE